MVKNCFVHELYVFPSNVTTIGINDKNNQQFLTGNKEEVQVQTGRSYYYTESISTATMNQNTHSNFVPLK